MFKIYDHINPFTFYENKIVLFRILMLINLKLYELIKCAI